MISKIQNDYSVKLLEKHPEFSPDPSDLLYCQNTMTSLQVNSLYSWIPALFNQIWWMIKSLFCCFAYPAHHHTEFKPEVDPHILSSSDPFFTTVFNSDRSLKNKTAYKLVGEIFDILGEGGAFYWSRHLSEINKKKEQIIENFDIHPLESLYLLFHNSDMSKLVCHFLDNTAFGIDARFFQGHAAEFKGYSKPVKPLISGFCKLLKLDETHVKKLVDKKDWQELIKSTYQTRKKHFNL